MRHGINNNCRQLKSRNQIAWLLAFIASLAHISSSLAASPDSVLVRLDLIRKSSEKASVLAVRTSLNHLIAACSVLKDASVVTDESATQFTLSRFDAMDDLCELSGESTGKTVEFEQRARVLVDGKLLAYGPEASALGWNEHPVRIIQKMHDGFHRLIFIDSSEASESSRLLEAAGLPLFNSQGRLVGITTHPAGALNISTAVVIEDLSSLQFASAEVASKGPKSAIKSPKPVSLLAPIENQFGERAGFTHLLAHVGRIVDGKKMLTLAEKWIADDPQNLAAYSALGSAYAVLDFPDRVSATIEKIKSLRSPDLRTHAALMSLYSSQKKAIDAELEAREILSLPTSDGLDETIRVRALLSVKDSEGAIALARQISSAEPSSIHAASILCEAEAAGPHVDLAIAACKRLTEITPDSIRGFLLLSGCYLRNWRIDDAIENAKRALEINREYTPSWMSLSNAYEAQGNPDRADEAAQAVKRLDEHSIEGLVRSRNSISCRREFIAKAWVRALELCQRAAENNSRDAGSRAFLGNVYLQQHQVTPAIDTLRDAVRLDPKYSWAWASLVYASMQNRDIATAREAYQHVKSLDQKQAGDLRQKFGSSIE